MIIEMVIARDLSAIRCFNLKVPYPTKIIQNYIALPSILAEVLSFNIGTHTQKSRS